MDPFASASDHLAGAPLSNNLPQHSPNPRLSALDALKHPATRIHDQFESLKQSLISAIDRSGSSIYSTVDQQIQEFNDAKTGLLLKAEEEKSELQLRIDSLSAENTHLKQQNDTLLEDIFHMAGDLDAIHDDDFYRSTFERINSKIETWTANVSRTFEKSDDIADISEKLEQKMANGHIDRNPYLADSKFKSLFQNGVTRIQLIRHAIARQIFKDILEPFIFGAAPDVSQALRLIGIDIMRNGSAPLLMCLITL
jgi:BMFP domain-containing protein YqiC